MGIINVIKNVKKIHEKDIILIRIGKFYYSYGKDAYLMSYLFKYKLMKLEQENTYSCAFPEQAFSKISALLDNKKINYIILDRRNNYDIEEKIDNKNLNKYDEYFKKAKEYVNKKIRIEKIYYYLISNISEKEINVSIEKMERIINERRKI